MIDKTDDTYFADNEPWIKLDPVPRLERALTGNADCQSAFPIGARALVVDSGPSGGPEALVYAHIEDLALGSIYGHVRRAPTGGYAAMLLHSDRFKSAEDKLLLFRRFDYWITTCGPTMVPRRPISCCASAAGVAVIPLNVAATILRAFATSPVFAKPFAAQYSIRPKRL